MKKRYGIGFLIGMIVFTLVLVCAYQLSYDREQCVNWRQNREISRKSRNM